jgi:hypothetical protein
VAQAKAMAQLHREVALGALHTQEEHEHMLKNDLSEAHYLERDQAVRRGREDIKGIRKSRVVTPAEIKEGNDRLDRNAELLKKTQMHQWMQRFGDIHPDEFMMGQGHERMIGIKGPHLDINHPYHPLRHEEITHRYFPDHRMRPPLYMRGPFHASPNSNLSSPLGR